MKPTSISDTPPSGVLEAEANHLPADWTPTDGMTVVYGIDKPIFDR